MSTYRVLFEIVDPHELYRYCDKDPAQYKNYTQIVPNSQIPDDAWHKVEGKPFSDSEPGDPWAQYRNLSEQAATDKGFVRNVRLQMRVPDPHWEPAEAPWEG
jgi:hypothetical protein